MASKSSVVMVSASFHPYVGGAEKQALELSAALMSRGWTVRILTRRIYGCAIQEEVRGVPIERLWCAGQGLLNALSFILSLSVWLWRHSAGYSVIHVHLAGSPALPAALIGRALGKRVVVKLGGGRGIGELAASSHKASGWLKLKLLAQLKPQFVVVTQDLAAECAKYLGRVPVRLMPNGVDTARYRPATGPQRKEARAKLGWPDGLGFLYVGRLSPEKRLEPFLEAWIEMAGKSQTPSFAAFVGDGQEGWRLKALARQHGHLSGRILIPGAMSDIQEAYAAADVFVLPSVSEGLSNALLEAMASGLAILGSRVGGTAEAVEEAHAGFLFEPHDGAELRRQLGKYLQHPELAAQLGAAARVKVLTHYALERLAQSYEELYTE